MKCSVCGKQLSAGNQSGLCQECYRKKVNEDKIAKWKEILDVKFQLRLEIVSEIILQINRNTSVLYVV